MTGVELGVESVTVNVAGVPPESPSVTVTSSIESSGTATSSSTIVAVPTPRAIAALVALDRATLNVSVGSKRVSSRTATAIWPDVSPAGIRSVPLVVV